MYDIQYISYTCILSTYIDTSIKKFEKLHVNLINEFPSSEEVGGRIGLNMADRYRHIFKV